MTGQAQIPGLVTGGTYWFGDDFTGLLQPRVTKMVLHSTETPPPNCPGYSAGASAPTLTINPWAPLGWQHFLANMSARALADSANTVVRENRDDVAQIEIIGYADYRINAKYALANIPESGLQFIANVLRFYNQQWGLPLVTTLEWPTFNSPRLNQVRLSGPAYDAYQGVLGHMHVSGNDHVDPAGLNITRVLTLANQGTTPPPSQEDDMQPDERQALFEIRDRLRGDTSDGTDNIQDLLMGVDATNKQLTKLAGQVSDGGVDPDALASAVVDRMGVDFAAKVIDALGDRIKPGA